MSAFEIDLIAKRGKLEQALERAIQEINIGILEPDLYFVTANLAFALGDVDKAEQLTNRLLALDPEHIKGWHLFGDIYSRKNNIIKADHARHMTETLFPSLGGINYRSGKSLKNEDNGKTRSQCPLGGRPDFDTVTFADICVSQGYYNKALKIYKDNLRKNPGNESLKRKIADIEKRLVGND